MIAAAVARGAPVAALYLDVLTAALHEVGLRWERAELTVAQEHLATAITQSLLAQLAGSLAPAALERSRGTVIVACTPGELHALGAQMVADFLEANGWAVRHLGASTPPDALAQLAGSLGVTAVALSTSLPDRLPDARRACALLRELPNRPLIVVGGQGYGGRPDLARRVGADALADTPLDLVAYLSDRDAQDRAR